MYYEKPKAELIESDDVIVTSLTPDGSEIEDSGPF